MHDNEVQIQIVWLNTKIIKKDEMHIKLVKNFAICCGSYLQISNLRYFKSNLLLKFCLQSLL